MRVLRVFALLLVFLPGTMLPNALHCFNVATDAASSCTNQYKKSVGRLTHNRGASKELYDGSPAQRRYCKALRNFELCINRGRRKLYGCNNSSYTILDAYTKGEGSPGQDVRKWLNCSASHLCINIVTIFLIPLLILVTKWDSYYKCHMTTIQGRVLIIIPLYWFRGTGRGHVTNFPQTICVHAIDNNWKWNLFCRLESMKTHVFIYVSVFITEHFIMSW